MISQPSVFLLIDGNNLAHFLYTNLSPGQKMTPADSQRLVSHMAAYAQTHSRAVEIELCLDRSPGEWDSLPSNLHIFSAEYPQTGDDLLLGRLWFHHMGSHTCIVITNDEAVLEEVNETGAASLRVYDFVRRPGLVSPVFQSPDELPVKAASNAERKLETPHHLSLSTSIYFRIIAEDSQEQKTARSRSDFLTHIPVENPINLPSPAPSCEKPAKEEIREEAMAIHPPILDNLIETSHPVAEDGEGPYYALIFENWPVAEGIRFLLNSFCPAHQDKYRDLMSSFSTESLRPADLRALGELLLHACGNEPGFAQHGSLMTRVRLALLQARGEPLSIQELAARTGLKVRGLRGRIRQKARPWLIIA